MQEVKLRNENVLSLSQGQLSSKKQVQCSKVNKNQEVNSDKRSEEVQRSEVKRSKVCNCSLLYLDCQ